MNETKAVNPLAVELRLQNVTLTQERKAYLQENLGSLPKLTQKLPSAQLHADLHKHPHQNDYHIKMSLKLHNETLFTGERDQDLMAAWHRCTSQMASNLKEYKEKLSRKHRYAKDQEQF